MKAFFMLNLKSIRVFIVIAALCLNSSVMKSAMFTRSVKMPSGFNASVLMDALKESCNKKLDNVTKLFADIDKQQIVLFASASALQAKETAVNNPHLSAILGVSCLFVLIQTFLPAEKRLYYQEKVMNFLREKYGRIPYPIRYGAECVFSCLPSINGKQAEGEESKKTRFDVFSFNKSLFQSLVIAFGGNMAGWPSVGYGLAGGFLVYNKFTGRFDRIDTKLDCLDKKIDERFDAADAAMKTNHTEAMQQAEKNKQELQGNIHTVGQTIETCKKELLDENGKLRTEATQNTAKITQHVTQIHCQLNKNIDALKEQMTTLNSQTGGKIDGVASNVKQLADDMGKVLQQHVEFKNLCAGLSQEISGIDTKQEELNVFWKAQLSGLSAKIDAQSELQQTIDTVLHNQKTLEENLNAKEESLNAKFIGLETTLVNSNSELRRALEGQAATVSNELKGIVLALEQKEIKNAAMMNEVLSKSQAASDLTSNLVGLFSQYKLEVSGTLNELVESHKKVEALIDQNLKAMSDFAARQDKADERIGRVETAVATIQSTTDKAFQQQAVATNDQAAVQAKMMEELKSLQKKNEAMQVAMLELTHLLKKQDVKYEQVDQKLTAISGQFEDAVQSMSSNFQDLKTDVAKNTENTMTIGTLLAQQGQQTNEMLRRIEDNQLQAPALGYDPNFVMPIDAGMVNRDLLAKKDTIHIPIPGSFGRGRGTPVNSLALNWLSQ